MNQKKSPFVFQTFDIKRNFDRDKDTNKNLLYLAFVGLGINILAIVFVLTVQGRLPPEVPLFYGMSRGVQQIVPKLFLLTPSLAAILIVAINFFLSLLMSDKFLKQVLVGSSILASLFAFVAIVKISLLVGNL